MVNICNAKDTNIFCHPAQLLKEGTACFDGSNHLVIMATNQQVDKWLVAF